jgi:hypothetical protein
MAKRRKSRKKTSTNNTLLTLIIIIVLLGIISVVTAYFMLNDENKDIPKLIENVVGSSDTNIETPADPKPDETEIIKTPIDGTWVSNYDGAMLTIENGTFSIEMPSVDASSKVKGTLALENSIVTFINKTEGKACKDEEGHYKFTFIDDELKLSKIKDACESRSERMNETWFRL